MNTTQFAALCQMATASSQRNPATATASELSASAQQKSYAELVKPLAIQLLRTAIAARPRISGDSRASVLAWRKSLTGKLLLIRLEDKKTFYPVAFAEALATWGVDNRGAIVETLREYFRSVRAIELQEARKSDRAVVVQWRREAADALAAQAAAEEAQAARGHALLKAAGAF